VAEQALDENSFLRNSREKIHEERDRLLAELQSRDLDYVDPAANFFLLEMPDDLTGDNFCKAMVRRGVIVRSMDPYGLDNYVRISVGAPAENDRFLAALDDFLE
jgi:histidinol-phosphate aminotransferase